MVASDFGDDGGSGNFADFIIGFYQGGGIIFERSFGEEVDFAVDDNFGEWLMLFLDEFDGAAGGEF